MGNISYNSYDAWISLEYAEFIGADETTITTETTNETYPATTFIKGDVDSDVKITINDLSNLKRFIINPYAIDDVLFNAFDLNSDGVIDLKDSKELTKILTCQQNKEGSTK